jgi:hypothetical protein
MAAQLVMAAQLEGRDDRIGQVRALGERYGYRGFLRFISGGPEMESRYYDGEWDEALQRADAFLAEVEAGSPHYQSANAYSVRALIRIARDDEVGAVSDAERAVELAPLVADPQVLVAVLANCAIVFEHTGDERRAAEALGTVITALQQVPHMAFAVVKSQELAWLAVRFGRERDLAAIIARETMDTRWLRAGEAVLAGDLRGAADVLGEIGARPNEAFCRLGAAERLVAEGRRAEADEQLRSALAFYRGVGATRYAREGEALLAASA